MLLVMDAVGFTTKSVLLQFASLQFIKVRLSPGDFALGI